MSNTEAAEPDTETDDTPDPETGLPRDLIDRGYTSGSFGEATVSNEVERVVIRDDENRRAWWFDLGSVSWFATNQILSECVEQTGAASGRINIAKYYREIALRKIDPWSLADHENANLATFLQGLDSDLGAQLEQHLPDPGGIDMSETEEKK